VRIFSKAALTAGLAGILGLGMAVGGTVVAHAASPTIVPQAGSDTTYFVMAGGGFNGNPHHSGLTDLFNASQSAIKVTQVPPTNNTGLGFPASVTVPAQSGCPTTAPWNGDGSRTWDSSDTAHTPPNGSSAGITALQNDDASANPGCAVALARSSRGLGNPSDTPDLESYAFALDALTWSIRNGGTADTFRNTFAPANLSISQITKIYTCFASGPKVGTPIIKNWAQVGGKSAPIIKYAPQAGSGTASFFQTKLLNGATIDAGCDSSHLSHRAEENQAATRCVNNDIACLQGFEPIPTSDLSHMIIPFGFAQWTAQKNTTKTGLVDARNSFALKSVEGIVPNTKTINEGLDETQAQFPGTRYVYNVLTQNEPNYAAAAAFAGINQNTLTNGYICQDANATTAGKVAAAIKLFGEVPLVDAVEGSGQPTGHCRFDATPL